MATSRNAQHKPLWIHRVPGHARLFQSGLLLLVLCLIPIAQPSYGQPRPDAAPAQSDPLDILKDQATVVLKAGRSIQGDLRGVQDGRVTIAGRTTAGEVEYSFARDEIRRIDFPGNDIINAANSLIEEERHAEALPLLEALYRQRIRYFDFMDEAQVVYFQNLAEGAYLTGDYYQAVGVARNVHPHSTDPRTRRQLKDLELLAHYHLPLIERTQTLADDWIALWQPYDESALGWYVLGQIDYDQGRIDAALDRALRPIVFSSQFHMDYLDHCYALAITAAVALEDWQQATILLNEMKSRGLAWPPAPKLESYRYFYTEGLPLPAES